MANKLSELIDSGFAHKSVVLNHWRKWSALNRHYLEIYNSTSDALPPKKGSVNPYRLLNYLTSKLDPGSVTVCADGTACVVGFQSAVIKPNQRIYHNSGCASMGYELPAAIGAYHASGSVVFCIAGDGSIMMNLQELSYIGGLQLPIKIILLNNRGYHSIRQTQQNYFPDNPVGCGVESGLPFPDFQQLASGFGINYLKIEDEDKIDTTIEQFLLHDGPILLEAILDLDQQFTPKLASKKLDDGSMITAELEDMTPLLGDDVMYRIRQEASKITLN